MILSSHGRGLGREVGFEMPVVVSSLHVVDAVGRSVVVMLALSASGFELPLLPGRWEGGRASKCH